MWRFWSEKRTGGQIVSAPLVGKLSWAFLSVSGAELARQMTEQAKCAFGAELVSAEAAGLAKTPDGLPCSPARTAHWKQGR